MKRFLILLILITFFKLGMSQVWAPLNSGLNNGPIAVSSVGNFMTTLNVVKGDSSERTYQVSFWNGTYWLQLPILRVDSNEFLSDVQLFKGAIYISGRFDGIGTVTSAKNIIKWQNRGYTAIDSITNELSNFNGIIGLELVQGNLGIHGNFTNSNSTGKGFLMFNGVGIVPFNSNYGSGLNGNVRDVHVNNNNTLFIGGSFSEANGFETRQLASFDGSAWTTYSGDSSEVYRLSSSSSHTVIALNNFAINKFGLYSINSSDEIVSFEKGITQTWAIYDLASVDGTVYASGVFSMDDATGSQEIIKLEGDEWVSLENGDLLGIRFLGNYKGELVVTGRFDDWNDLDLNHIALYKENSGVIRGHVYFDKNANCVFDDIDENLSKMNIRIMPDSLTIIPKSDGTYSAVVSKGEKIVSIQTIPFWQPTSCSQLSKSVTLQKGATENNVDFSLKQNFGIKDLAIRVHSNYGAAIQDGKTIPYIIKYSNQGSDNIQETSITFEHDARLIFKNAKPAPSKIENGKLTWEIKNMYAGQTRYAEVSFEVDIDSDVSPVSVTASIAQQIDEANIEDNSSELTQALTSTDFEFKKEIIPHFGSDTAYISDSSEKIEYQISFANYTADTIHTVYVVDSIKVNHDMVYIKELAKSSDATLHVLEGKKGEDLGVLVWTFTGINLPPNPSQNPEITSHIGFVSFEIGIKDNLVIGNTITNKANVTFDYYPEEPTNQVFAILSAPASIDKNRFEIIPGFIYPNPVEGQFKLESEKHMAGASYVIVGLDGRIHKEGQVASHTKFDVGDLFPGIYILKVKQENSFYCSKFLKL